MPQELTTEYNMENWREATKDWTFMPYCIEGYGFFKLLSYKRGSEIAAWEDIFFCKRSVLNLTT